MTFVPAGLGDAFIAAVLLCFGCTSTDNAAGSAGAAGQSAGHGGESAGPRGGGGAEAASSSGASGSDAAGGDAGGSAGAENEAGMGSGGDGMAGMAGMTGIGGAPGAGSGGLMTAGATAAGGDSGSDECAWDPASTDNCPVCDAHDGCARPSYKYVGSGAITSSCCGLEWQEETAPGEHTWSKAAEYCESLALLGGGWRLPKIAELYSLVDLSDESHASPTIDVGAFADTLRAAYWSASLAGKSGQAAWTVDFTDGASLSKAIDAPSRVRCVR